MWAWLLPQMISDEQLDPEKSGWFWNMWNLRKSVACIGLRHTATLGALLTSAVVMAWHGAEQQNHVWDFNCTSACSFQNLAGTLFGLFVSHWQYLFTLPMYIRIGCRHRCTSWSWSHWVPLGPYWPHWVLINHTGSVIITLVPCWPHGVPINHTGPLLTTLGLFFVSLKMDDSIYVVQSGKLCVSVVEKVSG